ncbi:MAG: hypothetical protein ACSHX6_13845 [Akkermansiaceae bacterium]
MTSIIFSTNLTGQEQPGGKDATEASSLKKLVILTGDDLTHACGTHEFEAGGKLLKASIEKSVLADKVECVLVHNWPEDASVFDDADMILHYYKGNKWHFMNKNAAFVDALAKKGVSQMFVHYACDPDTSVNGSLKLWTGGVYKDKFSGNPFWTLKSILEKHPINQGVKQYTLNEEWYLKMDFEKIPLKGYDAATVGEVHSVMSGENVDKKAGKNKKFNNAVKNDDGSATVVFWAKESANGCRGIAVTGAHYHTTWANDDFRKQVLNSVNWGLKLSVPETGIDSPAITEEQLNQNLDIRKPKQKALKLK